MYLAFSSHWNLISPTVFRLWRDKVRDLYGDIPGTDAVRPCKPHPVTAEFRGWGGSRTRGRSLQHCLSSSGGWATPPWARASWVRPGWAGWAPGEQLIPTRMIPTCDFNPGSRRAQKQHCYLAVKWLFDRIIGYTPNFLGMVKRFTGVSHQKNNSFPWVSGHSVRAGGVTTSQVTR